jgi:hypothetical protein
MKFLRVCYARLPLVLFCLFFAHLIDTNSQRAASAQKASETSWSRIKKHDGTQSESTYTLGLRFIRRTSACAPQRCKPPFCPGEIACTRRAATTEREYHNTQSANYTHPRQRRRRYCWRARRTKESKWLRRFFIRASIC